MTLAVRGGAAWELVLDRPESANALDEELVEALLAALDEASAAGAAAIVLRGNPRHFAAGFDLGGLAEETDAGLALRLLRIGVLLERLRTGPWLTVALVEGTAVGAGADLALACDHRIGTRAAGFAFPGARFGLVLGTARLAGLAGADRALDGSRPLDAERAAAAGLLTELTDRPEQAAAAVLERWSATAPVARTALLRQSRQHDTDGELAALARSVAVPGLRSRILAYAAGRGLGSAPTDDTDHTDHTHDTEENR
ncbi:MAG: enoyl-CoA hydratase/isomerase family protein [Nocardioides sp.]|uniref:enoyl-CoA hydratase/isomerase family protein n=1 Tax=Nocardioides sp. TaxID=35761 RepID=UPI0039E6CD8F